MNIDSFLILLLLTKLSDKVRNYVPCQYKPLRGRCTRSILSLNTILRLNSTCRGSSGGSGGWGDWAARVEFGVEGAAVDLITTPTPAPRKLPNYVGKKNVIDWKSG